MISAKEATKTTLPIGNPPPQTNWIVPPQDQQDIFAFLGNQKELIKAPSFFSKDGLSQDIIQVTHAEPDICLEVFYALHNVLLPQIETHSLKNAWTLLFGSNTSKGILSPPEQLFGEMKFSDLKRAMSEANRESQGFHALDAIIKSISDFKQELIYSPEQLSRKEEIIASLTLLQEFYRNFGNKVTELAQSNRVKDSIETHEALEALLEPKAIMMSDIFSTHWAYRVPRSQARVLLSFDALKEPVKTTSDSSSNHHVVAMPENGEPLVYFISKGSQKIEPQKEFMHYSLYRHLQIPVPETALVILTNVFEATPNNFYAVQASEVVHGKSALETYQNPLKNEAYVPQVIGAFLTNPSDGSLQNFQYSPKYQSFISIDNIHTFEPELCGQDCQTINVKSILYLLPQIENKPIPESVQTYFTTLDPHLTTFAWLKDLSRKNQDYKLLFERLSFIKVDGDKSIHPYIHVSKNLVNGIAEKLQKIERALVKNRAISTQNLFEEVSPILARYYQKLRLEFSDIKVASEALWRSQNHLSSLLNNEGLDNDSSKTNSHNQKQLCSPEDLFEMLKRNLATGATPLDKFIMKHNIRKMKNSLNLQEVLTELRILIQEGFTHSKSFKNVVDFSHNLSKNAQSDDLIQEIKSLLLNLPNPELKWLLALENHFLRADSDIPNDLISSSPAVSGAFMGKRTFILTQSENKYILNKEGDLNKNPSLTGRSNVTWFPEKEPQFFLKQYPEWPGYEYASSLFMRLLGITNLAYQDLILFHANSKTNSYPVLVSQKVDGDLVLRIWQKSQAFNKLDPFHTGLLIIAAMLLNPEDGKEDNFILSKDGKYLIPIDNDHCFLPSTLRKEGNIWSGFTVNTALQTKTLLFCLDEMNQTIPSQVRQHLLSINFDELFTKWMKELVKVEDRYNNLANDDEQRSRFFDRGTIMRIPFYQQFIESIHWKAHRIKDLLTKLSDPTPFDLLKAVEPFAARCFQDSFKKSHNTLESRFKAATNKLYTKTNLDGSRMSILNTRAMMEIIHVPEKEIYHDPIFQKMGSIDALELLNQLIQNHNQNLANEKEFLCELDNDNKENKWFALFGNPVMETALKEFFENPKEGLALKGNKLITSSKLTTFFKQTPNKGTTIRFLSLPESPLLSQNTLRVLVEACPNLEYLNVSHCFKLKEIVISQGEWPLLTRLEALGCSKLEKLTCYSPINIVRVGTSSKLQVLFLKSIPEVFVVMMNLQTIQFSLTFKNGHCSEIKQQHAFAYSQTEFDKYFENLSINMGPDPILSGKDLGLSITHLDFSNQKIQSPNIQMFAELHLTNLKYLNLSNNDLFDGGISTLVFLGKWPLLEELHLSNVKFSSTGMGDIVDKLQWPLLKHLNISFNKINKVGLALLTLAEWPLLETLNLTQIDAENTEISTLLLVANFPNLQEIIFSEADTIKIDPTIPLFPDYCSQLESLDLSHRKLTSKGLEALIKISQFPQLKEFNLSGNALFDQGISALALGNWPLLEELNLENTNISSQALVHKLKLPKLTKLNISSNPITSEALHALTSADWPQFKHLVYYDIKITLDEALIFMNNFPKLDQHEFSFSKLLLSHSQQQDVLHGLFPTTQSPSDSDYKKQLIIILNTTNAKAKEVSFFIKDDSFVRKIKLISREEWDQQESLALDPPAQWDQEYYKDVDSLLGKFIVLPSNLKRLSYNNLRPKEKDLTPIFSQECPLLEELSLENLEIKPKRMRSIFNNKSEWPNLKKLNIGSNPFGDQGLEILVSKKWPHLEELNVRGTEIKTEGVQFMVANSNWPNLKKLNISSNAIQEEGIKMLVSAKWPLLEDLNLYATTIPFHLYHGRSIQLFFDQAQWPNMKKLAIHQNPIGIPAFEALVSIDWPHLEDLNLHGTTITLEKLQLLVHKSNWPNLKRLDIAANEIRDEGLDMLTQAKWPLLEDLDLWHTRITDRGIESIVIKSHWPNLKTLNLSENPIQDGGLEILASAKWPLLQELDLRDTKITTKGLKFINKPQWFALKTLKTPSRL